MSLDLYSKHLESLLQSNIVIRCDSKIIKTGKLKLFVYKQYFIRLFIETSKGAMKICELPYPFEITSTETGCIFNYQISKLTGGTYPVTGKLRSLRTSQSIRMYDNKVYILTLPA